MSVWAAGAYESRRGSVLACRRACGLYINRWICTDYTDTSHLLPTLHSPASGKHIWLIFYFHELLFIQWHVFVQMSLIKWTISDFGSKCGVLKVGGTGQFGFSLHYYRYLEHYLCFSHTIVWSNLLWRLNIGAWAGQNSCTSDIFNALTSRNCRKHIRHACLGKDSHIFTCPTTSSYWFCKCSVTWHQRRDPTCIFLCVAQLHYQR